MKYLKFDGYLINLKKYLFNFNKRICSKFSRFVKLCILFKNSLFKIILKNCLIFF